MVGNLTQLCEMIQVSPIQSHCLIFPVIVPYLAYIADQLSMKNMTSFLFRCPNPCSGYNHKMIQFLSKIYILIS